MGLHLLDERGVVLERQGLERDGHLVLIPDRPGHEKLREEVDREGLMPGRLELDARTLRDVPFASHDDVDHAVEVDLVLERRLADELAVDEDRGVARLGAHGDEAFDTTGEREREKKGGGDGESLQHRGRL